MKKKEHKTKVGKYCNHLKKIILVSIDCINTIDCEVCKEELKSKHNSTN